MRGLSRNSDVMNVMPFPVRRRATTQNHCHSSATGNYAQAYTSVTHAKGADLGRLVEIAQPGDTGTPEAIFVNHQIIIAGCKGKYIVDERNCFS